MTGMLHSLDRNCVSMPAIASYSFEFCCCTALFSEHTFN